MIVRRDTREKITAEFDQLAEKVAEVLDTMQKEMLERARAHRDAHTYEAVTYDEFKETVATKPGFIKAMWCGDEACENKIKEETTATEPLYAMEAGTFIRYLRLLWKKSESYGILGESILKKQR